MDTHTKPSPPEMFFILDTKTGEYKQGGKGQYRFYTKEEVINSVVRANWWVKYQIEQFLHSKKEYDSLLFKYMNTILPNAVNPVKTIKSDPAFNNVEFIRWKKGNPYKTNPRYKTVEAVTIELREVTYEY